MCGIAGLMTRHGVSMLRVQRALEMLKHRGPDSTGYQLFLGADGVNTGLLHTRLRIIDLDVRSNQPMGIDGNWLVFNGEIYNYREVRDELLLEGVKFSTNSDTEVLLRGILRRGWSILDELEGMWAFAFYREDTGVLTLCRDRFGEKPLWIRRGEDGLSFASEVPVLEALSGVPNTPDLDHLRRFLVLGYKSLYKGQDTFITGVTQVPPGVLMRFDPSGDVSTTRYWTPSLSVQEGMSFEDAVSQTRDLLLRSVDLRLRADVPLAFSLSGGVDSVALASLAATGLGADVHGFTIMNTDPRYEERTLVEQAVRMLGIKHTWVPLSTSSFLERLRGLVATRGEPVLTLSSYVQALLMEQIGSCGYKVVVGGVGADELFTGYYDHHLLYLASVDPAIRSEALFWWEQRVRSTVRNPFLQNPDLFIDDPNFRGHITLGANTFNSALLEPVALEFDETLYHEALIRNRMLNELFHEAVPVLLHEEDLNAMHYSLENRSPFLDRELMEFAYSIPSRLLIRHGYTKAVLREAVRGSAPDAVLDSPRKVGFNVPIGDLLPLEDPSVRAAILEDSAIWDIVDRDVIAARLGGYQSTNSQSKFLFSLVSAKAFLDSLG